MNAVAVLIALLAWASLLLRPGDAVRVLLFLTFLLLGTALTLIGGFQYWWSSRMLPSSQSALILVCGVLTLLSQAGTLFRALLSDED
jgi:drug/metabolite transporter (DMT)-like permease